MSPRRAAGEATAALASVGLHYVAADVLHVRIDVPVLGVAWIAYLVSRVRAERAELARLGLSRAGLGPASAATLLVLLLGVAVAAAFGSARGQLTWHWHLAVLLALYPLWGLLQQVLVFGVFLRALETLVPRVGSPPLLIPLAAVLFGLVHCGDLRLFSATAVLLSLIHI